MNEQHIGPSPEGVMHGPYPKTENHPWDQANGIHDAIDHAEGQSLINAEQATALDHNAYELDDDASREQERLNTEADNKFYQSMEHARR